MGVMGATGGATKEHSETRWIESYSSHYMALYVLEKDENIRFRQPDLERFCYDTIS